MLKALSIVAATALCTATLPSASFAQMDNGSTGGDSMSKESTGDMSGKSSMMKKSKMHHHSMHHSMMTKKKSMSSGM